MSTLSLRVQYRPIRIGWCLEGGNREQFRRALRFTHSFAGGRFNPLIPVDVPELAENLLDRFGVDVLFPLEESEKIGGFIEGHDYLRWPEFQKAQLFHERWEDRPPYGALVDIYHVARRIREEDIGEGPEPPFRGALYSWDEVDPLRDVLLATVGAYPAPSPEVPDYEDLFARVLKADKVPLRLDEPLPADLNTRLTPSRLSTEELHLEAQLQQRECRIPDRDAGQLRHRSIAGIGTHPGGRRKRHRVDRQLGHRLERRAARRADHRWALPVERRGQPPPSDSAALEARRRPEWVCLGGPQRA